MKICQENIRTSDLFARWGGDEFVILLVETDLEQAGQFVRRISRAIVDMPIEIGLLNVSLTISLGLSTLLSPSDTLEMLLSRADQALYSAKRLGRNQVVYWKVRHDSDTNVA